MVMTLQEKEKKKAADHSEGTECPVCLENEETRRSTLNITDKTAILGGGKSKRQWMTSPEMYKVSVPAKTSMEALAYPWPSVRPKHFDSIVLFSSRHRLASCTFVRVCT